ncbi:MAG: hypothetical protein MK132_23425 [Lentisphaerales bacterium]|nr:hypothetical protein [Lentisphaerales bacterium]
MKTNFHILIDVQDKAIQKDVVQIISSMCLDSLFVNFNPSPGRGPFHQIPCDMLIFSLPVHKDISAAKYRELQLKIYPEATFIFMGKKFYFYDKSEILEIPKDKFIKYLTRCLLNQYLEFNKRKITEELKRIKDWKIKK